MSPLSVVGSPARPGWERKEGRKRDARPHQSGSQRTCHLVCVRMQYVLLFLAATVALPAIVDGHSRWLLASSWAVWLLWQVRPSAANVPWAIVAGDVFPFASWQALFFSGMVAGHH